MASKRRNPGAVAAAGASENDHAARLIGSEDTPTQNNKQLPLIDRNGRRHSEAILHAWSPKLIEVMGIRWAESGEPVVSREASR